MIFPFTAIVGQDDMKMGLILNVIDPSIGGLLIMGERGTAKSTTVRALAELLPEMETVTGCPFNCDPGGGVLCTSCRQRLLEGGPLEAERKKMRVVELPLGVTEDRLVGTLDIENALRKGEKTFAPGILADANRNFLYVDEVNLLEDHIVDLLLDSAAMGVNTVEREGISFTHPSRFILVGTMNPEEGELRPQLLDRFGLCVHVRTIEDRAARIEILKRRTAFDIDARRFTDSWRQEQERLSEAVMAAKRRLENVVVSEELLEKVVDTTVSLNLDGHRADIVMTKAARALAAFRGREEIDMTDVADAARLTLNHRMKRLPFEEMGEVVEKLRSLFGL